MSSFIILHHCVEKVIEPNQHAQFFFRLFKFNFLADAIIIEGTFDLCTLEERNSVKALYEKTFDGEECDYIDTPKMPCPILSCKSRELCANGLPHIKAICINDASIEIKYFTTQKDSINGKLFGFDSEFLFANGDKDFLDLYNASIKIGSGVMRLKNQSKNDFNNLNIQSGVLSGERITIYNLKIQSHKRMNKKNKKNIIHVLLGLSISTICYCMTQGIEISTDTIDNFINKKLREINLRNDVV